MPVHHPAKPSTTRSGALRRVRRGRLAALAVAALAVGVAPAAASAATDPHPVTPVAHVDLSQYLGTWYQVAALPQWYEALCLKDVTAKYSLNGDGTVKVVNSCSGPVGTKITQTGKAKVLDTGSNASLEVSFVNLFNWWLFTGKPNYDIVGLGADDQWAVVGDPARQSGFVLSRTPTIAKDQLPLVVAALLESGYNPCLLPKTVQTGGATDNESFCSLL